MRRILFVFTIVLFFVAGVRQTYAQASLCYCSCGCCGSSDPDEKVCYTTKICKDEYEKTYPCGQEPIACPNGWTRCCVSPCGGGATPAPTDNPGNPSNPGCFPTAPSAPVLLSPLEAATAQNETVTLSWEAAAGWGEQCDYTTKEYRVCVATNKVTLTNAQLDGSNWASYCDTTSTVVASPTTTASVAISTPGTYYWRVASYNGHYASESIVRSLEVPTLTSVTGRVYASNDLACTGTTPATGYTGGTMTMINTDGLSGYVGDTQAGVNSSATFTVPGNTTTGYQYSLGFANDDTNWIMKCPLPASYTLTVKDQPIEQSFFVTQVADAWWQVAGGDVAAPGNIVQRIPGAAEKPYGSYATASMDSGALIAGSTIDTNNVSVGPTTNWKVSGSSYHTSTKEGYSYFMRVAEMGTAPTDDFTAGQAVTLTHDDLTKDPVNLTTDDRKGLYHQGDVTLGDASTPIALTASENVILFVNGNVMVDGNITVANGGYFAVIAKGTITFSGNSYTAHGQYVADGILKVQDAASGDGVARQFVGEGNFVGWQGVTLERSLQPAADILANNKNPAELFIYRPDLIMNTPLTLKHGSVEWQEVAPRQLQ